MDKLFADLKAYGLTDDQVWNIIDDMAAEKARRGIDAAWEREFKRLCAQGIRDADQVAWERANNF